MPIRTATMLAGLLRDTSLLADAPAALRVRAAVDAHVRRTAGPQAGLLAPLTCPASRLDDLLDACRVDPLPFVLVMDTGTADLPRAVARVYEHGSAVLAGVEVPTRPDDDQGPRAAKAVRALGHVPAGVPGWVEVHPARGWRDALGIVAARGRGVRIRAGAGPAEVRPSATQLAKLIRGCVAESTPFTCSPGAYRVAPAGGTAGQPRHHGLLNLVLAVCRAQAGGSVEELAALLAVRDPADLLAELLETGPAALAAARRRLHTVGCDDVVATLLDLADLGLATKTAGM